MSEILLMKFYFVFFSNIKNKIEFVMCQWGDKRNRDGYVFVINYERIRVFYFVFKRFNLQFSKQL